MVFGGLELGVALVVTEIADILQSVVQLAVAGTVGIDVVAQHQRKPVLAVGQRHRGQEIAESAFALVAQFASGIVFVVYVFIFQSQLRKPSPEAAAVVGEHVGSRLFRLVVVGL